MKLADKHPTDLWGRINRTRALVQSARENGRVHELDPTHEGWRCTECHVANDRDRDWCSWCGEDKAK